MAADNYSSAPMIYGFGQICSSESWSEDYDEDPSNPLQGSASSIDGTR
jgi:hypothetical protein